MSEVFGIDISHWQGEMKWATTKTQVHFVYIKATESKTVVDSRFQQNWHGAKQAGLARGAYHFFRAHSDTKSPLKQAELFAQTLGDDLGELPPIVDIEDNTDNLTKVKMENRIWKFINRFEELTGRSLGVYTSPGFWNAHVAVPGTSNTDIPRDRLLWVASWNPTKPSIPWDWYVRYGDQAWTFWQWTNKGDGAKHGCQSAAVDLDRYNGDLAAFNTRFNLNLQPLPGEPPITPPPPPDAKRIRISGLQGTETLRLRASVWGTPVGYTYNNAEFAVMGNQKDDQGRLWYQVGKTIWLASWYTTLLE